MIIALVGLGQWGARLVPKLLGHPTVEGLYGYDIDRARSDELTRQFPVLTPVSDYDSILHNPRIEAVVIATPVASHYPLAKQALDSGKHVWVEKPLTNSVRDAQTMVECAAARKLILFVDHITVYSGAAHKIKQLIAEGEIGKILYFDTVRANLGAIQFDVNVVWDLAIHECALIDYLLGEIPRAVSAVGFTLRGSTEEIAYLTLFFDSGIVAHIHVSWLSPLKIRRLVIGGAKKMLVFDDTCADAKLRLFDRGVEISAIADRPAIIYRNGDIQVVEHDQSEPLAMVVDAFVRSIEGGQEPYSDGKAGLRMVRILQAADQSIKQQGAKVYLD